MSNKRLCSLTDLNPTGAKGLTVKDGDAVRELFVVRDHERVCAYENHCPHTGGPLDWTRDQFLDEEGKLIVCSTHLARFRINDVYSLAGPCAGLRLRAVEVRVDNGLVRLNG